MMPKPENVKGQGFHTNPERINRKGRLKGVRTRSTLVKRWLEAAEKVKNPITGHDEQLEQQDIMILAAITQAREGNIAAFRELMDSAYGKIAQTIQHEGMSFENVQVIIKQPDNYKD